MIKSFRELEVWKKAHELALLVYRLTNEFPRSEEYGLKSQMRDAAVSIPLNIAEGFKRSTNKDSNHFYNISEASLEELKYQSLLSFDLNYINKEEFDLLTSKEDEVGKMLYGWKKSQKI